MLYWTTNNRDQYFDIIIFRFLYYKILQKIFDWILIVTRQFSSENIKYFYG